MPSTKFVNHQYKPGSLKRLFRYLTGPGKTSPDLIVSNCGSNDIDEIYNSMMQTKRRFNKLTGNELFQEIISFSAQEVQEKGLTPDQVCEFGRRYAEEKWGWDNYQWTVICHVDREHLHCHIVLNSVSPVNGKKWSSRRDVLMRSRQITDNLAREYGYSVCEKNKTYNGESITTVTAFDRATYEQTQKQNSWLKQIYTSVNQAAYKSNSYNEFTKKLWEAGIIVRESKSHLTFIDRDNQTHRVRESRISSVFHKDFSKSHLEKYWAEKRIKQEATPIKVYAFKLERSHYILCQRSLINLARRHNSFFWVKDDPIAQTVCIMTIAFDFLKLMMELVIALNKSYKPIKQPSFYIEGFRSNEYKSQFARGIKYISTVPIQASKKHDEKHILGLFEDDRDERQK